IAWLNDRLSAAYTAALVLSAAPEGMVPDALSRQILDSIGARAVVMKTGNQRKLLAMTEIPPHVDHEIDVRDLPWSSAIFDRCDTLPSTDNDVILARAPAPAGAEYIEIIVDEVPLRHAMYSQSIEILKGSLLISGITAMLVFFALHYLFVRPLRRITANMI